MSRDVPLTKGSCDLCPFKGMVFDFMGDCLCPECAAKAIPAEEPMACGHQLSNGEICGLNSNHTERHRDGSPLQPAYDDEGKGNGVTVNVTDTTLPIGPDPGDQEARDKWMRENPLTQADMNDASGSAHAFWEMPLAPSCHPDAGLAVVYKAPQGVVEMACLSCKALTGTFWVAKEKP
jgi:hypothetical protein